MMLPFLSLFINVATGKLILSEYDSGLLRWGKDGHAMSAIIGQYFSTETTQAAVSKLIPDGNLEAIASWADEVRHEKEFAWSAPLHFIDVLDYNCTFVYNRDCKHDWCVAGAIANYSRRLVDTSLSLEQRSEALKFVVHFVGDIHQPLHVGWTTDKGGNTIKVHLDFGHFHNTENLHAVWDDYLIYWRMDANYSGNHTLWADNTVRTINTGKFQGEYVDSWLDCPIDEDYPCTTAWAEESIGFACNNAYRFANGELVKSGNTLYDDYYERNIYVVENRLARAGFRMARLLNTLLDPVN